MRYTLAFKLALPLWAKNEFLGLLCPKKAQSDPHGGQGRGPRRPDRRRDRLITSQHTCTNLNPDYLGHHFAHFPGPLFWAAIFHLCKFRHSAFFFTKLFKSFASLTFLTKSLTFGSQSYKSHSLHVLHPSQISFRNKSYDR